MYMMYICSMFLSCLCNCALFVNSSHVEEIKNIIIIIIISPCVLGIKLPNRDCRPEVQLINTVSEPTSRGLSARGKGCL